MHRDCQYTTFLQGVGDQIWYLAVINKEASHMCIYYLAEIQVARQLREDEARSTRVTWGSPTNSSNEKGRHVWLRSLLFCLNACCLYQNKNNGSQPFISLEIILMI
jgi:hypothetical protein